MQVCCTPCFEKLCLSSVIGMWQGEEIAHKLWSFCSCLMQAGRLGTMFHGREAPGASHDLGTKPRSAVGTGHGQVWEAECWQSRQAGMLPLPAHSEARQRQPGLSLLSQSSGLLELHSLIRKQEILLGRWAQGVTASSPC